MFDKTLPKALFRRQYFINERRSKSVLGRFFTNLLLKANKERTRILDLDLD